MSYIIIQDIFFIAVLVTLSVLLGIYINKVMMGEKIFLTGLLHPVERFIYKLMGIHEEEEMSPRRYSINVLAFSFVGFIIVFLLLLLQNILPFNPEHKVGTSWHLAFNTAASFVSNTNWQAYSGENTLSYFSQSVGLTVQNFLSAAIGISVLFALLRGFIGKKKNLIGSFWKDLTRVILYILIPLSLILAVILVSQGVVQSLDSYHTVTSLENEVAQTIPLGPAASQIAIKQLGTNGGGFFGANSAFPLENPTALSNLLQMLSILLIPASLCVSFGKAVKDYKQGRSIYSVMLIVLIAVIIIVTACERYNAPSFTGVSTSGNLEGKEIIHGIGTSSLWGTVTTAASNGSVNSMHDSFTPISGLFFMFLMQIGEVIFGGVGSGLYGMLAFVLLTVFIVGLMVGRTPEYLGKKVEPFDMKMVCLIILTPPLLVLLGTAATVLNPEVSSWLTNSGAHGFSEIIYAYSSMGNNNGSAFAGLFTDNVFINVLGGIIMLLVRYIPIIATLFLAGNMSKKKLIAASEGTLSTSNTMFIGLLLLIILIIGALSFLPALALGPISDYFTTLK